MPVFSPEPSRPFSAKRVGCYRVATVRKPHETRARILERSMTYARLRLSTRSRCPSSTSKHRVQERHCQRQILLSRKLGSGSGVEEYEITKKYVASSAHGDGVNGKVPKSIFAMRRSRPQYDALVQHRW